MRLLYPRSEARPRGVAVLQGGRLPCLRGWATPGTCAIQLLDETEIIRNGRRATESRSSTRWCRQQTELDQIASWALSARTIPPFGKPSSRVPAAARRRPGDFPRPWPVVHRWMITCVADRSQQISGCPMPAHPPRAIAMATSAMPIVTIRKPVRHGLPTCLPKVKPVRNSMRWRRRWKASKRAGHRRRRRTAQRPETGIERRAGRRQGRPDSLPGRIASRGSRAGGCPDAAGCAPGQTRSEPAGLGAGDCRRRWPFRQQGFQLPGWPGRS